MNKRELEKWRENYTVWGHDTPCLGTGLYLHCHFDEKDDVKRLGGQWNPAPNGAKGGHWWIPNDQLTQDCLIECDLMGDGWSGTTLDWLDNHKMVAGQYGRLSVTKCLECTTDADLTSLHRLLGQNADSVYIYVYQDFGIVRFMGPAAAHNDQWLPTMEARQSWELLMETGYREVVPQETE